MSEKEGYVPGLRMGTTTWSINRSEREPWANSALEKEDSVLVQEEQLDIKFCDFIFQV